MLEVSSVSNYTLADFTRHFQNFKQCMLLVLRNIKIFYIYINLFRPKKLLSKSLILQINIKKFCGKKICLRPFLLFRISYKRLNYRGLIFIYFSTVFAQVPQKYYSKDVQMREMLVSTKCKVFKNSQKKSSKKTMNLKKSK